MKYKILKGTALFEALAALEKRRKEMIAQIRQVVVTEMGFHDFAFRSDYLAGCQAVQVEGEKPDGWKKIGGKFDRYYWPLASNKAALEKLNALPSMPCKELNDIVKFGFQVTGSLNVYDRPGWVQGEEYALINVGEDCKYTPLPDMIEIKASEFKKLWDKVTKKEKEAQAV
jgi:hypothetical protein